MDALNWTRIVGVMALIAQFINFGLTFFVNIIPHDVAIILAGVLGFISAVTERIQGGASKL